MHHGAVVCYNKVRATDQTRQLAHMLSWLARIPIRIGYRMKIHVTLTHPIEEMKRLGERHEADYNFDLLSLIGVSKPAELKFHFPLTDRNLNRLEHQVPDIADVPYAVFHPSASPSSTATTARNGTR